MNRRLCFSFLAAVLTAATLSTGPPSASAAIRVTISSGGTPTVFVFANNTRATVDTTIDGIDIVGDFVSTNFPGEESGAGISQSITVNDRTRPLGSGVIPTLTFTAELVDLDNTPLRFTAPSGSPLFILSDVSSAETRTLSPQGRVQNLTTVNGVVVPSLELPLNTTVEGDLPGTADNTPTGFHVVVNRHAQRCTRGNIYHDQRVFQRDGQPDPHYRRSGAFHPRGVWLGIAGIGTGGAATALGRVAKVEIGGLPVRPLVEWASCTEGWAASAARPFFCRPHGERFRGVRAPCLPETSAAKLLAASLSNIYHAITPGTERDIAVLGRHILDGVSLTGTFLILVRLLLVHLGE